METGRTHGERSRRRPRFDVAGSGTTARPSGRLSGHLHWLAGSGLAVELPEVESPAGVLFDCGTRVSFCIHQHGNRSGGGAPSRPPVVLLCGVDHSKRGTAQERPANVATDVYRAALDISGARGRQHQRWEGKVKAGSNALLRRDRDPGRRGKLNATAAPCESFNPLILQSSNQLIRNLVIRESHNQLINQSRRPPRAAVKIRAAFASFACAGRWSEHTENSNHKSGSFGFRSGLDRSVLYPFGRASHDSVRARAAFAEQYARAGAAANSVPASKRLGESFRRGSPAFQRSCSRSM